jgi:triosephosphate isomerase
MPRRELVNERDVLEARRTGKLYVPPGTLLTPLARDMAEQYGVSIVYGKPRGRHTWIVGNWKSNKTISGAIRLVQDLLTALPARTGAMVGICPPYTALPALAGLLRGTGIHIGAQDISPYDEGAYTGEVTANMLRELGVDLVIVGHSERRAYFKETSPLLARKLRRTMEGRLVPILCFGETLEEREAQRTQAVLRDQLFGALDEVPLENGSELILAYEPVWAIGTGITPLAAEINDTIGYVRDILGGLFGRTWSRTTSILYGGSVNSQNIGSFLAEPEVDGALVGGASLKAGEFARLIPVQE